jgi:hypothetical protein
MYGSYDVCPVCGWEDDCVQLANPTSEGGANKRSLWSCQQVALELVPRETEIHDGFSRDPRWRPLNVVEVNASNLKKSERHWHAHGIVALAEAYWMLSSP